jgi:hypothetical protein
MDRRRALKGAHKSAAALTFPVTDRRHGREPLKDMHF